MEVAALNCGDIFLDREASSLLVRKGKGNKRRMVFFNQTLRGHIKDYLKWKQSVNESTEADQPLFLSSHSKKHMTTRALQKAFKRCSKAVKLSPCYSFHSLRHSHACFLLKASGWNLRLVQKQLGHSNIETAKTGAITICCHFYIVNQFIS